jgi:hypothetical protein
MAMGYDPNRQQLKDFMQHIGLKTLEDLRLEFVQVI